MEKNETSTQLLEHTMKFIKTDEGYVNLTHVTVIDIDDEDDCVDIYTVDGKHHSLDKNSPEFTKLLAAIQ